jgi:hypothetical protein
MARTSKRARKSSPLNVPGAFELFTPSKELVLKNIWIFGPLYAVPLIFGIHDWIWSPGPGQPLPHWWNHAYGFGAGAPGSPLPTYNFSIFVGFSIFWLLFVLILGTIASVMGQAAQLDAVEGRNLDFQDLWKTCRQIGLRMFGLYLITGLIVVVGFILFIIPGIILARRYFLAPYIMLDKKTGIRESLERSAALSKLNTGSIYGIFGVLVVIALIGIIPFIGGIIAFGVGALYSIAPALRYQQLKKLSAQ